MWKFLNESVEGTSHKQVGLPCQDCSFVTPYQSDGDEILILACADGAGSASESLVGAKLTCEVAVGQVTHYLDSGRILPEVTEDVARSWLKSVHEALRNEAEARQLPARELACTLLLAAISASSCVFAQVGDGAIVTLGGANSNNGAYAPVFWPQSGEYQNTTYFITEQAIDTTAQVSVRQDLRVDELAMFTDGLQMLALNYAARTAHQPFFAPMFRDLRAVADRQELIVPLRQFLDSPKVNERTDDDKTMVLATRMSCADASV